MITNVLPHFLWNSVEADWEDMGGVELENMTDFGLSWEDVGNHLLIQV